MAVFELLSALGELIGAFAGARDRSAGLRNLARRWWPTALVLAYLVFATVVEGKP